jgi:hypothetical protein
MAADQQVYAEDKLGGGAWPPHAIGWMAHYRRQPNLQKQAGALRINQYEVTTGWTPRTSFYVLVN